MTTERPDHAGLDPAGREAEQLFLHRGLPAMEQYAPPGEATGGHPHAEAPAPGAPGGGLPDGPGGPRTAAREGRRRRVEGSGSGSGGGERPTARDLLPRSEPPDAAPAEWGWRGALRRATGGAIAPAATAQERRWRRAQACVRRELARPVSVVFANPKGGAGKTPACLLAAYTFGVLRGGYVLAWDNNETRGTLGVRADAGRVGATVWDLLNALPAFERIDARAGDLAAYVRHQAGAQFDVLASDEDPGTMAQIGREEFARLRAVLGRFYRVVCVDTGNNVRADNWQAAIDDADMLVVTTTWRRDDAFSAAWMLDHLESTGRGELVARAVTVVSARDPRTDPVVRQEVIEHFAARTRAVLEIPYDPQIAAGERLSYPDVAPATREAWTYACAAVVEGLPGDGAPG